MIMVFGSCKPTLTRGGMCVNRIVALVVAMIAFSTCFPTKAASRCAYDKKALLALDEKSFDQELANGGGGWRAIAHVPGCELAAAGLLAAYRAAHPASSPALAWHEGQLRASAGEYDRAIALLGGARKAPDQDPFGWNDYVDATIAFLRHDKAALLAARKRLAAVAYPAGAGLPPLKGGYMEFPAQKGQPARRLRWPPNIEVVDALVDCFGKRYSEAYGASCRAAAAKAPDASVQAEDGKNN